MDAATLKNYINLKKEIALDDQRIDKLQAELRRMMPKVQEVTDIVTTGKRGKKPLGAKKIHGYEDHAGLNKKRAQVRIRIVLKHQKLARLEERVAEAEAFVDSIEDDELRLIVSLYCMDERLRTWEEVAACMGPGYTADACRMAFRRGIK